MTTVEKLLKEIQALTPLDPGNTAKLIGLGIEMGLPSELAQECELGDQDPVNIGNIAGLVRCPRGTAFMFDHKEGWFFSQIGHEPVIVFVGDWWPALAYLRIETLIGEMPTRFVDLGSLLGQALELGKALGLPGELVGKPYHPNADAPIPRTVTMTPVELLQVTCSSRHELGDTWKHERGFYLTICEQGDNIKYELRVLNLPPLLKAVVEALDKRAKNLEIAWPA